MKDQQYAGVFEKRRQRATLAVSVWQIEKRSDRRNAVHSQKSTTRTLSPASTAAMCAGTST
jgi:hypothetical protein